MPTGIKLGLSLSCVEAAGSNWTPLRLNPYFAYLPGINPAAELTSAPAQAGIGDAIQEITVNMGSDLEATSAANRGVLGVGANGRKFIDCASSKFYVGKANFGKSGNFACTFAMNVCSTTAGLIFKVGLGINPLDYIAVANKAGNFLGFQASAGAVRTSDISIATWCSVVVTFAGGQLNGTTVAFWGNGVAGGQSGTTGTPAVVDSLLGIGMRTTIPADASSPKFSDLLFWDRVLTSGEISRVSSWLMARRPT